MISHTASSRGASAVSVAVGVEDLGGALERPRDQAAEDGRADLVQAEGELGDDAEPRAGAAQRPEQVGVLVAARPADLPVGGDDLDLEQVVDRPAEAAREVAEPAAERQAGDADLREEAERRRPGRAPGSRGRRRRAGSRSARSRCARPGRRRPRAGPTCRSSGRRRRARVPAMLWPPPRTATRQPAVAGVARPRARRRPCRPAGRRSAGRVAIIPFQSRVASSKPSSSGRRSRPAGSASARRSAADERLGLLDRRVVGAVLDHVQRPAVAGARRLGHLERRGQVVRGPRSARSGRAIRSSSSSGIAGSAEALHQRAERGHHARRARAVEVVGRERLPALAHPLAQRGRGRARSGATARRACARSGSARNACSAAPNSRRRLERPQAERVDEHETVEPVAVAGGEARRDRAAERVADERRRLGAGALDQLAEPVEHARRARAARTRPGPAGRARSRGGWRRARRARAPSGRRCRRDRAGARAAGRRRPRARRSRRRRSSAAARRREGPPAAAREAVVVGHAPTLRARGARDFRRTTQSRGARGDG